MDTLAAMIVFSLACNAGFLVYAAMWQPLEQRLRRHVWKERYTEADTAPRVNGQEL